MKELGFYWGLEETHVLLVWPDLIPNLSIQFINYRWQVSSFKKKKEKKVHVLCPY